MKKVLLSLVMCGLLLSGCNAVHGFGEDLSHVGNKIQDNSGK